MAVDVSEDRSAVWLTIKRRSSGGILAWLGAIGPVAAATPVLHIDATEVMAHVSPLHAGLMTEEINHAYDGGLYGELLSNRAFEDEFGLGNMVVPHWTVVQEGSAAGVLKIDDQSAPNKGHTSSARLDALAASSGNRVGLANDGYWGIPVKPNTTYSIAVDVKSSSTGSVPLTASIESLDGGVQYAQGTVTISGGSWHRYTLSLTTGAQAKETSQARFVLSTEQPKTLWFGYVSLFAPTYHGSPNGNRVDLMEKLRDLHPAFLRFPGGNYLEGDTIATRFDWKQTLGPVAERPTHMGPWKYHSSDGLGLLEFLRWCEDLNMEPVLGVFAGNSLGGEFVAPGPELQPYVQDALDEIEYVTGASETTWGARRVRDGHPTPFPLHYVEVGNEDWNPASKYDGRFAQFYDAIRARYPKMQLIASTSVTSRVPDVLDEHYYRSAAQFMNDVHHYDLADRKGPKIFVGEWASVEGEPTPNMNAALGDAAWMTGMERNADLVILQAYAPLLANVNPGGYQWRTNLIGYDALTSYGSPSYYAQVIFNAHCGDVVVRSSPGLATGLFHSVTRDTKTGTLFVKMVNTLAVPQTVEIEVAGAGALDATGELTVLAGAPAETNTLQDPRHLVPVTSPLTGVSARFPHTFAPNSITVMELHAKTH